MLGARAVRNDGLPHGTWKGDPVLMSVEKREKLLAKMALVEECAKALDGGEWYAAMMQHVCYGKTCEMIDVALLPTCDRNTFYRQRRLFFELLDQRKD